MLKTLKWVYNLGVTQERQRIAAQLQIEGQRANISRDAAIDMLREHASNQKLGKGRKEKLEFSVAVNDRVQLIINEMFRSNDAWVPGASFIFPDEEAK